TCDDGNTLDGDSCPSTCHVDACGLPGSQTINAMVTFSTTPTTPLSGMNLLVDYPEGAVGILGSNDDTAVQAPVTRPGCSLPPNALDSPLRAVLTDPTFAGISGGTALNIQFDVCQGAAPPPAGAFTCTVLDATDANLMPATDHATCEVVLP